MEHFVGYKRVEKCWNRKRKGLCLHTCKRSFRRGDGVYYVKDYELCGLDKGKEIVFMTIKAISPVEYWARSESRYAIL